jgi:CubicO group peptidase (beta-lactamase class C family)
MRHTLIRSKQTANVLSAILIANLILACLQQPASGSPQDWIGNTESVDALVGLWKAENDYGPPERGTLEIQRGTTSWTAWFGARKMAMSKVGNVLSFELPDGRGAFRALVHQDGGIRRGQWFQLKSAIAPEFASSVVFDRVGRNRWVGTVRPVPDNFVFYLMVQRREDGSVGAFLRNPQMNLGLRYQVDRLVRDGDSVRLVGKLRGQNGDVDLMKGSFDKTEGTLTLSFDPPLDAPYKFKRVEDGSFYPRGKSPVRYTYRPPLARSDGWSVASLDDVNISREGIESFVQRIVEMPMESLDAMQIDGILIARHGKLVVEEYFHGFDHKTPHSSRSASKSITSVLVGSAINAGLSVRLSEPVYRAMNGGEFPQDIEPRKKEMSLEHLLTMSSGLFCDDGDPEAPAAEERMINQTDEPDFYRFSLRAPLDRTPGEQAVYCSGDPNLAIGVLSRVTGEHPMDLFDRLIAEPLKIGYHAWFLSPSRQPYGGGSLNMTPRDFLKIGQLMLSKGVWNGRRVLSEDFVNRSSSPLYDLNGIKYGYLWWVIDFPYKERTVRAYFAGGNGGQAIMVVPELDIVIVTQGSSYGNRVALEIQQGLPPRYILPAVREAGDRKDAPVVPKEYKVIYGRKPSKQTPKH